MSTLIAAVALLFACWLDHRFGEPRAALHPVVGMGRYLGAWSAWLPGQRPAVAFGVGAFAWCLGAAAVVSLAWAVQAGLLHVASLGPAWLTLPAAGLLLGLALKPLFAWRMLADEVAAVEVAQAQGLDAARQQLSRLVSRDTSALSETEVRESALESLAENLNDSVVAPLLWFAVAGLPGAALYRFINTADAMWGYRGRWEWAGKWAARADDVASWLPARLTAGALLLGQPVRRWRQLPREARRTPSPNSGWPMAAAALALDVAFSKPGVYRLHDKGRPAEVADTARAIALCRRAVRRVVAGLLAVLVAWQAFS